MRRFLRSVGYAAQGFGYAVRTQRHMRIHLGAAAAACLLAAVLGLNALEWALLAGVSVMVIAMELINTAVECIIDLVAPQPHPLAKAAKDAAAAAVLVSTIGAVATGCALFMPRLIGLFNP